MQADDARRALKSLIDREPRRHPLVIGFVSAIGTSWSPVMEAFEESLRSYGYSPNRIHIAGLMDGIDSAPWDRVPHRGDTSYYKGRMNAGDELRRYFDNGSAMAALAVREIKYRKSQASGRRPTASLLRSLKHPDEVRLLRAVYGEAFFLVGVVGSERERRRTLSDDLSLLSGSRAQVESLMERDESNPNDQEFGQNVRDTYAMADVFVTGDTGVDIRRDIDRFVGSIFGEPFLTPMLHEEGMRYAQDAALRSSAAGRQVGAALIPRVGTPIVSGTNEVPKPGGGQYWEGDSPDYRDFRYNRDPNPVYARAVVQDLLERLADHGWLAEEYSDLSGPDLLARVSEPSTSGPSVLEGARAASLIEFTRCMHAEQAAIVNAARAGVSTIGATLYSTTFPCHECAKLIVGAGIGKVYYIEPYPKSLVDRLYQDLIETSPIPMDSSDGLEPRLPFYQFVGIAPRWYSRAFTARIRKVAEALVSSEKISACPQTHNWSERGVEEREDAVIASVTRLLDALPQSAYGEMESDDEGFKSDAVTGDAVSADPPFSEGNDSQAIQSVADS